MKIYKLTDQNLQTYNGFQWELGVAAPELPAGGDLCSSSYYHAYTSPLLAVFLNSIHADIENPKMFEAEGFGELADDHGLKVGYKSMVLVKELELPAVTLTNRIAFGILCSLEVYKEPAFVTWAENWLNGTDRTIEAAWAAARAAWAAARAARAWAARAARAAAWAAERAAASWAAAEAAAEARAAARAAAAAARAAAAEKFNLIELAKKAMKIK
ncbi:MAG: hypothetical protein PHG08_01170, partial [Bacilli bacterium]|nr:hypothetical protein [Bacilli bacterium]